MRTAVHAITAPAHPHVHLVVKAVSEQGERLNIRKATLRNWRQQFATHLREQGILANATERAVRGQQRTPKRDAIYRAMQRNESMRERMELLELARRSSAALRRHQHGKEKLERVRSEIVAGWYDLARRLQKQHDYSLADEVQLFVRRMTPPATDQEQLAERVLNRGRAPETIPLPRTR